MQEVGGSIPPGSTIQFQTNHRFATGIPIAAIFPRLRAFCCDICGLKRDFQDVIVRLISVFSQASKKDFPKISLLSLRRLVRHCSESGSTLRKYRLFQCEEYGEFECDVEVEVLRQCRVDDAALTSQQVDQSSARCQDHVAACRQWRLGQCWVP